MAEDHNEELASEMIAARLRDPNFQDRVAVARTRDVDLSGNELESDLIEMNDVQLRAKYGDDVYRAASGIGEGMARVRRTDNNERTFTETADDSLASARSAIYRTAGNISGLGAGWLVEKMTDGEISREQATADIIADHTKNVEEFIANTTTEDLQENRRLFEIEGQLDGEANQYHYEQDLADGMNPTMAAMRREGRNALDAGERMFENPTVAGAIISEGVGDLALSVPMAGAGGLIAAGATKLATRKIINDRVRKVIAAAGISAGAAPTEIAGVYAESVNDVMSIPTERLAQTSSIYNELLNEGMTPDEARAQLAGMTAETAAIRQIAPTLALGFITSKFEAMPIGSFRGVGVTKGLLSIAGEGIEEAGQGASGTMNRNISVEQYAEIGRGVLVGVGEEAAIGALAGMGTAGVMATPNTARAGLKTALSAPEQAAEALLRETSPGGTSRAFQAGEALGAGLQATAPARQAATQAAKTAGQAVRQTVQPAADAVNEFNARDERKQTKAEVKEAVEAARIVDENIQNGKVDPKVGAKLANDDATPSAGLADSRGSNLVGTVANIMERMQTKKFKLTKEDKAFAAAQIQTLKGVVNSLPGPAKRKVMKLLSSKAAQTVVSEATELDLNKEAVSESEELSTTVNVAKTNPANVNPETTKRLLEESGENISPEDTKFLRVASRVAETINNTLGQIVSLRQETNLSLQAEGRKEKDSDPLKDTGRSILATGYTSRKGKALRSVNDFASDIIQGLQSPDGTIINQNNEVVPVRQVAEQFAMFLEHMNNRVQALNTSYEKGGSNEKFRMLLDGDTWVEPENWTPGAKAVFYNPGSATSAETAQRVAMDRDTALAIYEAISKEFPDLFEGITLPEMVSLVQDQAAATSDSETNPTVLDDDSSADGSEEQNPQTQELDANLVSELNDLLTLMGLLGIPVTSETTEVPSAQELLDLQERIKNAKDTDGLAEALSWIGNDIRRDNDDRKTRAKRDAQKRDLPAKESYLTQLAEEILEVIDELDTSDIDPQELEIRKRELKVKRFGADTVIKDGPYKGKTNAEALAEAKNQQTEEKEYDIGNSDEQEIQEEFNETINPTVVEEETNSEEGAVEGDTASERSEASSEAEPQTGSDEEIDSDEQSLAEDEMTEEEIRDLMDSPAKWNDADRQRIAERANRLATNARAYVSEMMGDSLKKRIRQLRIYPASLGLGPGYAYVSDDGTKKKIYLSETMFDENDQLTDEGKAVLLHESAHVIDFTNEPKWISQSNFFREGGKIRKEWDKITGSQWVQDRMEYANSFKDEDPVQHQAEMFAVLTEFYYSKDDSILENSPEILAEMEQTYGPKTQAVEPATDETVAEGESTPEGTRSDTTEGSTETQSPATGVNPVFDEVYVRDENTKAPESVADLQRMNEENGGLNPMILEAVVALTPDVLSGMNARLGSLKTSYNGTKSSIRDHILAGRDIWSIMKYRSTALVNPETGQFDEDKIGLAMVAVVDWLANASASDPGRFSDTLEKQGLSYADITDEQVSDMMFGIPPAQLKAQLANDILRMWGVKPDNSKAMVEVHGIAQSLASEILVAMSDSTEMDYFTVKRMKLPKVVEVDTEQGTKEVTNVETDTVLLNMERIRDFQTQIRDTRAEGVKDTAKGFLFDDDREKYSIGQKIKHIYNKSLSRLENKAVKTMQDTAHYLNEGLSDIFSEVGDENLMRIGGYVSDVTEETVPNGTLRRSIMGKNLSIQNDLADAGILAGQLMSSDPVHYPVDVTSVGRHQYQGVNPQSNKWLRALVTPTWATVDIETQEDMVWLAVAQGSDLHKIEKNNHAEILSTVRDDFEIRYGEAKDQILSKLRGGPFDADAFTASVLGSESSVEPQVLAAIYTVAKMQHAKEMGDATFDSSLSVELDGLTNGAANMMVNFAQGLMSASQWENFKRIGFYIGKTGKTINDFFGNPGNLDMYETVARAAQAKMNEMIKSSKVGLETLAARRIAGHFGDFKMNEKSGQFEMTRNSAKNPMTKVNYGSGVMGVGSGLADDMLLKLFEALHGNNLADIPYAGDIVADFATMGIDIPKDPPASWEPSKAQVKAFRQNVSQTIGKALTEAAKETLGDKITEVNDMLVFSTNVQAAYLNELFDQRMTERAEELAKEGKIRRHPKTQNPIISDIPVEEYNVIVKEMERMSPIFTSDEQTLEIGGFKTKIADDWPVLASAMDDRLNQKPMLKRPDDVGVKAIPFTVIGTGDAMMMNLIFGSDNAPQDVLGIFDGLDVPVTKLQQYAPMVNQKVMQSWDRDVLSMVVANFRGFLGNDLDQELLQKAFQISKDKSKKSSVTAANVDQLLTSLEQRLKENQAFKAVLKKVPLSVDQMGGSGIGFSRGEGDLGLSAINDMIRRELNNTPVETVDEIDEVDVKNPVKVTTVEAVLKAVRFTEQQKKIMEIIRPALADTNVVFGTIDQLNTYRRENYPDDGLVMTAGAQYDPVNEVLFMAKDTPETILHELVHAGTFAKVQAHYEGTPNDAVTRLEGLVDDFLAIEKPSAKVREAQASILRHKAINDPFHKAAAVNELMAYVLANAAVRKKAKETQANSLASLGSKVIRLMRRLLGGAPESIFDGVVFNTQVLIGQPIDDREETGGNGDGGDGNGGGEITPPANNYTNYWIQQLSDYLNSGNFVTQTIRKDEQVAVREAVNKIVDDLRQVGMLQNPEAVMTFKAIYGVVNSEISLNSQALISMTKMFNHIVDNMTPEMFGDGSEANQEYSAVLNAFGKNNNMINSISVLLALSENSAKFRQVLDQIPAPNGETTPNLLPRTLSGLTAQVMNNITGTLQEKGTTKEVMAMLAETIVEHDKDREYLALRKVTSGLDKADRAVSGAMTKVAETVRRVDAETKESSRSKVRKHLTSLVTLGTNYLDQTGTDLSNQLIKNKFHMGLPVLSIIPVREFVAEMVGTDKFNQNVVALQDRVNAAISGARQAYREDLPGILSKLFTEKPSKDQWKSMYNALAKTDLSALVDLNNVSAAIALLEDGAERTRQIRNLETQIDQKLVPYVAQDAKEKAEQLANYMTSGEAGKLLMQNAYAIAKNLDGNFDESLVPLLDQLTSLYALDMMDADQRQDVVDLYGSDPEAIEQIVTYIKGLNEAEDQKPNISEMARMNALKGYIPNEGGRDFRVVVEEDSKELDMKTRGFRKVAPYEGDPNSLVDRSYYVTNVRTVGQYAQGTLQNVAASYRGIDINTGLPLTGDTTGFISGDGVVGRIVEQLNDPSYTLDDPKETLIPMFDEDGTVAGFTRSINPDVLDVFAGREENLALMLGAWAGRQLEETTAYEYNVQLIDELDRIWNERETGSENLFVDLSSSDDPIYAESFRLIPQNLKAYIDTKFGGEGMMVRKDMANLSVGYREASLADMWTGKTRLPKDVQKAVVATTQLFMGRDAMRNVVKIEELLQTTVSTAKDWIVIRSLVVPALNLQANIAQLATRGVPMKSIKKDFQRKLAEVEQYNKNVTKIIELNAQIDLRANANQKKVLRDKIKVLEDLNKKMSIAPMIEAGAYKNLSEGITEFDQEMVSGRLGDFMEKAVAKLPNGFRTIGEYGLVSKSTKIYKFANRATQYGDFLGKSIYYDHLLTQGFTPEDAVARINEEFVNFTTQPGRVRSGLERNGLSWFMAFKIRIAKIAMQQMRDNPVRALAINGMLDVGSPIEDNIFSVIADGRLDYATGFEMMFGAPELNPWYNLISD